MNSVHFYDMIAQNFKISPLLGVPSERAAKIRDEMLSHPFEFDIERARCYTRIYKKMENAHPCIKQAKALEEFLRCMPIRIDTTELLVGKKSSKVRSDPMEIEQGRNAGTFGFFFDDAADPDLKEFLRVKHPFYSRYKPLSDEEEKEMKE